MTARQVYFAVRADGAIKIGCSRNPRIRCRSLGYALKLSVLLLASFEGHYREERALHRRFASKRIGGEWFAPNQEMLAVIAGVLAGELPTFTFLELAYAAQLKAAA
jgi:hypothetical protein